MSGLLTMGATGAGAAQYKIYFSTQTKDLTVEADENVATIVKLAVSSHATTIAVVGHADTAEMNGRTLSLARARSVRAALLRHKLPKKVKVTVKGVGDAQLLVPTPPHTSEPINRFVEVTF